MQIGLSYGRAQLAKRSPETTLEDFLINRFGNRLYRTFFKDYTEKVWGVPCQEISAEWGAQRIKGLSVRKGTWPRDSQAVSQSADAAQKHTETSLIERFLYPKFGPGQMWEEVARRVRRAAERFISGHRIVGIERDGVNVTAVNVLDIAADSVRRVPCDYFISTMPVCELVELSQARGCANLSDCERAALSRFHDRRVAAASDELRSRLAQHSWQRPDNGMPPDNWIYIQEPDVRIGRLQVFNNWSPALVADPGTIWLGLEYFCREGDELWSMDGRAGSSISRPRNWRRSA